MHDDDLFVAMEMMVAVMMVVMMVVMMMVMMPLVPAAGRGGRWRGGERESAGERGGREYA